MTRLKAVKPEAVPKRPKIFLYGAAGSWKTSTAIQFPSPYLIDTERGAENEQYVQALKAAGGVYMHTTDLSEITEQVLALMQEKHGYRTLIVDPLTVAYNDALDTQATANVAAEGGDGTEFGRHKRVPDRAIRRLIGLIYRLDMNVVITSHEKIQYKKVGNKFEVMGTTFDCFNKLDYMFDLVLATEKRGQECVAIVRKSRVQAFADGEAFPLSYEAIADRYGREVLERGSEPVKLASPEQVARLTHLVDTVKINPEKENAEIVQKWLDASDAGSFSEMPEEIVAKCIAMVEARIVQPAAPAPKKSTTKAAPAAEETSHAAV